MGIFFKDAIKQHNLLIIIIITNIDKSKVRQKSDKFLYFSNVKEKGNHHNFLNINALSHKQSRVVSKIASLFVSTIFKQ